MMSIVPEGEILKKAVKWVSEERKRKPEKKVEKLVEEACMKFDLPPKDAEFLMRLVCQG